MVIEDVVCGKILVFGLSHGGIVVEGRLRRRGVGGVVWGTASVIRCDRHFGVRCVRADGDVAGDDAQMLSLQKKDFSASASISHLVDSVSGAFCGLDLVLDGPLRHVGHVSLHTRRNDVYALLYHSELDLCLS